MQLKAGIADNKPNAVFNCLFKKHPQALIASFLYKYIFSSPFLTIVEPFIVNIIVTSTSIVAADVAI